MNNKFIVFLIIVLLLVVSMILFSYNCLFTGILIYSLATIITLVYIYYEA